MVTHYQHNDSPDDASPDRPGRYCGPQCDLYEPADDRPLPYTVYWDEAGTADLIEFQRHLDDLKDLTARRLTLRQRIWRVLRGDPRGD